MIDPVEFIQALEKKNIRFVSGVPDTILKNVCACFTDRLPAERHIIATNEGSAVGLAIGHYLATGHPGLVYMQNAGLGNVVNPLASLADPQVYGIPMVLMIGWRGEILIDGRQINDEPQHVKQGRITLPQLEIMEIPYRVADEITTAIEPILEELVGEALRRSGPVALVVRKGTFSPYQQLKPAAGGSKRLSREDAIKTIIDSLPDTVPIVSTTGKASRELYELRKASGNGHSRDFLTVGGMGYAGQIAAGIAHAKPGMQVVCLDGDGAILMHMGSLAISADCPNLLHIVLNNAAHDSVGGQPTKGASLDFARIAGDCGYTHTARAESAMEIVTNIRSMLGSGGSSFLEIRCNLGARADLGRPDRSPQENKRDFMEFLEGKK